MQWSTDVRQIKAALWDQAFIGMTRVSCPMGRVVAIRRRKGSSFHRNDACELPDGACGCYQAEEGAAPGDDP